jgi:sulfur-carrier protein adenylyltransferase/sulfurtransferase
MGVMDYFKPVSTLTAQQVREFLGKEKHGDYNLIDVRQPGEYKKGHLPGARLIPVGELSDRLGELDPAKPVIVY